MDELIVADSGPLIALGHVDCLGVLAAIHARVIVPAEVERECMARPDKPAARAIEAAFDAGWLRRQPAHPSLSGRSFASLGPGESAAIELAEALGAILLIDERRGRAVATARSLRVVGTVAVLVAARRRDLIPALAPLLDTLRGRGDVLSDALIEAALARVGEGRARS